MNINLQHINNNIILKGFIPIQSKEIRHWPSGTYEKQDNGTWKKISKKTEKVVINTKYLSQNDEGEIVLKDKEINFNELLDLKLKGQKNKIDLDIKLNPNQVKLYQKTLSEAFNIRPLKTNNYGYLINPEFTFKEKDIEENLKKFWKQNQPKQGDTFFNISNYQNVINKLEDYKKEWERVSDGSYGEGMKYLSQKYLPKIEEIIKQSEPLIKYFEKIRNKYKEAIEYNENQLKQIKLTQDTINKLKEEKYFNSLSEQEKQNYLNKLERMKEYPESWNYGVFARWTGD
jgi:hypothetical protein